MQRAAKKAGVPKWTPYQLRRTNATDVANTHSKEDAQLLLGHGSIATTEIYIAELTRKIKELGRKMEQK